MTRAPRRKARLEKLELRRLLTVPATLNITPDNATVGITSPITLTGRFEDIDGWQDLRLAEFRVANTYTSAPRCLVRYDQNTDLLKLHDGSTFLTAGSPGSGTSVSTTDCSLNPVNSSVTVVDANTIDVSVELTFESGLLGSRNLWLRGFEDANNWGVATDHGDISIVVDTTPPAAPTGLAATPSTGQVDLDWNDNGETDLAGYDVYRSTTSGSGYTKINTTLVTSSDYTDSQVANGTTYYYVVQAIDNSSNASTNSNQDSATPTGDTNPPGAPTGLAATPGSGQISLDWTDNGEGDLDGYDVYRSTTSGSGYTKLNASLISTSNYVDNQVSNGTTYYYVVQAVDTSNNASANSGEVSAAPSGPALPTTISITPNSGTVGISAPITFTGRFADANGWEDLRLAEFRVSDTYTSEPRCLVRYDQNTDLLKIYNGSTFLTAGSPGSGSTVTVADCSLNPANSTVTVVDANTLDVAVELSFSSSLIGNRNLWLRPFEDANNWGTATDHGDISIVSDTNPPAAPTGLVATPGTGEVDLDWNDNGESDLAGYDVYRSTTSGSGYARINTALVTTSNYTDNQVNNGTTYYYVVQAVDNSSNASSNSNQVSATPTGDTTPPAAPTGLAATPGSGQISLDWADSGEGDLDGYDVYRSTTSGSGYAKVNASLLTASNYVDSAVTNGTTYYYVVQAIDTSNNASSNSNEASAAPSGPTLPTTISITPSNATVGINVPTTFTGRFADANGWQDLRLAELRVADTYTSAPRCLVRYDQNTDLLKIYNGSTFLTAGSPGSGSTVSVTDCSLNPVNSTVTVVDADTIDVAVELTFFSGLTGDRNLWLRPFEDANNWGTAVDHGDVSIVSDTTPPAAPTGLSATAGDGQVDLNWNDNGESDLAGYDVYRSVTSGSGYTKISASLLTNSDYTDNSAANGTTYYYVVQAVDNASNASANSAQVSATPADSTAPAAPTGLAATAGDGQVDLDWNNNGESDLAGYDVYRSVTSGSGYTKINASLLTNSDYIDNSVANGTTYYYVVQAVDNSSNASANSAQVSATPADSTPPSAPSGLSATAGNSLVTLDWNDNGESDLAGYDVYRSVTSESGYAKINAALVTSSGYNDNSVANGTTYYYVVQAIDTNSNASPDSAEVSAMPAEGPATPMTVSVTPDNGTVVVGQPINITGRYADANGQDDIRLAELRVSNGYTNTPRCFVRYDHLTSTLKLFDDNLSAFVTAGAPGSGITVSSANCSLDAASSSVTNVNDDTIDVQFNLTFTSNLAGTINLQPTRNLWLSTMDLSSTWSSDDDHGDLSIQEATNPTTVSVSPLNQSVAVGSSTSLTGQFSDINGYTDLSMLDFEISNAYQSSPRCYVQYDQNTDTLRLYDDNTNSFVSAGAPGSGSSISNSFCTLDAAASSTTVVDTETLDVDVDVTFASPMEGVRNVWLHATDDSTLSSGETDHTDVTVASGGAAPTPPQMMVATPGNGSVSIDWQDNPEVNILGYDVYRSTTSGGPYTKLNTNLLTTSDYSDATALNSNTYYYVTRAVDTGSNQSVNSAEMVAAPGAGPFFPSNIAGAPISGDVDLATQTIVSGTFADGDGVADLDLLEIRVSLGAGNVPRCYVRYDVSSNELLLFDELTSSFMNSGIPGSSGTATNSSCTLYAAGSSVMNVDALTTTVNAQVSFASEIEGERNIWLRAFDVSQNQTSLEDFGDLQIGDLITIVDGYTDAQSYDQNTTQQVYVNATSSITNGRLDLYDVFSNVIDSVTFNSQPQTPTSPTPAVDGFGYNASFSYNIGNLPSGVYLWGNRIPFVVKDTTKTSEIRVVMPTNTANAYTCTGGQSTYNTCSDGTADRVSFNRMMETLAHTIPGTSEIIRRDTGAWSIPFYWWLEQEIGNLGVSYGALADIDLDDPTSLDGADVLVIPGHSEYWTRTARETFDNFVAGGGHVALLSGNTMWWQSRYENDQLVVYKSLDDPISDPLLKTINWDHPTLQYPILTSIGSDWPHGGFIDQNPPNGAPPSFNGYKVVADGNPLLAGANVANGDIITWDSDLIFSEYDGPPISGVDGNGYPIIDNGVLGFHQVELIGFDHAYRLQPGYGAFMAMQPTATSGYIVNAGTMLWAYEMTKSPDAAKLQTITYNILDRLINDQSVFTPSGGSEPSSATSAPPAILPQNVQQPQHSVDDVPELSADSFYLRFAELNDQPATVKSDKPERKLPQGCALSGLGCGGCGAGSGGGKGCAAGRALFEDDIAKDLVQLDLMDEMARPQAKATKSGNPPLAKMDRQGKPELGLL